MGSVSYKETQGQMTELVLADTGICLWCKVASLLLEPTSGFQCPFLPVILSFELEL